MFAESIVGRLLNGVDACPWGAAAGRAAAQQTSEIKRQPFVLYTPEERRRRDASPWTLVQGILAPVQFAVFLMSLGFIIHFMATGRGETAATVSVVVKTVTLYTIMVTGAIWERKVFGRYLFAPAFFWEDMVSMVVIALHTIYLWGLVTGALDVHAQMLVALAAYATYVLNATQFVMKLRAARLEQARWPVEATTALGAR